MKAVACPTRRAMRMIERKVDMISWLVCFWIVLVVALGGFGGLTVLTSEEERFCGRLSSCRLWSMGEE